MIARAVSRFSWVCTPRDGRIVIGGSAPVTLASDDAGSPLLRASRTSAYAAAAPPAASARRRPEIRRRGSPRTPTSGRAPQTIVSAASSATFVAHSVRIGAMSRAASNPTLTA